MSHTGTLTLGFISSYCAIANLTRRGSLVTNFDEAPLGPGASDVAGFVFYNDFAAQLAVDAANNSSALLRGVAVRIKRFSDCGPHAQPAYSGRSGPFAAAVMAPDIAENHADVVALVANQWSATARVSAQMLSLHKIPFCSAVSASPVLGNKQNYPYLWRMQPSGAVGDYFLKLLEAWGVKRVAVVVQSDDNMSFNYALSVASSFALNDRIQIVSTIRGITNPNKGYLDDMVTNLKINDPRYIIILGQSRFVSTILYGFGKRGIVGGDRYVYLTASTPQYYGDPIKEFGVDYFYYLQGTILLLPKPANTDTDLFKSVNKKLNEMTGVEITPSDFIFSFWLQCSYDCTMMMLLGLDRYWLANEGPKRICIQSGNTRIHK
ncbi:periplasmic binding protein-like I [Obelidium mucronatum]|nr:periplasmic binding protein-like I [Obelidium mucronatum]